MARKIYVRPHSGVGILTQLYGGVQHKGVMKRHHATGSGKIIRYCLQQLEKIGVLKRDKKHDLKKLSRFVTKEGQTDLNRIATQVALDSLKK